MIVDNEIVVSDVLFPSNNLFDIPTLDMDCQPKSVALPFRTWGANKRSVSDSGGTLCFYVDDYRFSAIWKNPEKVLIASPQMICEPNFSLFDSTPNAFGLYLIYKKRWLSRFYQTHNIAVFVDLHISPKFYEYNKLGVPIGYNAFSSRGHSASLNYLQNELQVAKEISGKDNPLMIVYGGGIRVHEFCSNNNLVYIESFINCKNGQNIGRCAADQH